jgi:dihydroorotate dehydrogenase (NAD+) catalytic subunit
MAEMDLEMINLSTQVANIQLENPLISASGILGETGKSLLKLAEGGAAAVTTKSITLEPRPGHPNPTIVELDYGLINSMGLPNPGIKNYMPELDDLREHEVIVIGSIYGNEPREFAELAQLMSGTVYAIELNLSCPNIEGYGTEIGSIPQNVADIVSAVCSSISIPVFAKLTPNTTDIVSLAKAAVNAGCAALVAINTVRGVAINPEIGRLILAKGIGGYSGPGIKPIGLRCVYELARADLGVPIIGVGGINTGKDVIEYLMAGATAVQTGTAVHRRGFTVFRTIVDEMKSFMAQYEFTRVKDLIGLASQP